MTDCLWERIAQAIYDVDEERGNAERPAWVHLSPERKVPWLKDAERVIAVWAGCRADQYIMSAYAQKALAMVMRANSHGDILPIWEQAQESVREEWRRQADFVIRRLKDANLFIILPDDRNIELVTAVKELMAFEVRDYIKLSERASVLVKAKRRVRAALSAGGATP